MRLRTSFDQSTPTLKKRRTAHAAPGLSTPDKTSRRAWQTAASILAMLGASGFASAEVNGPGDDRTGYESADYESRSSALSTRKGEPADLIAVASTPPLGLPSVPIPSWNPLTKEKIALGRKLFFDRRLSLNGTQSCAMCHIPEQGFTSNELATAVGLEGRSVGRNTPTLYNVAYQQRLFHDAREGSLEHQVWQPMLNPREMANPSIGVVLERLAGWSDYRGLFEAAFGGRAASMETVGQAIASYERTLLSANSAFDRWRFGGESGALGDGAKRGFALFTGKAGCSSCHFIGIKDALFTDQELHNTGVGYRSLEPPLPTARRILLAPGVYGAVPAKRLASLAQPTATVDLGRYRITHDPADRWHFKTPSLRNVTLTAPYMHDGSLPKLEDVIDFYNSGGISNPLQDSRIRPLGLSEQERSDLIVFLGCLTGETETLVHDAFAAPVGDVGIDRAMPQAR